MAVSEEEKILIKLEHIKELAPDYDLKQLKSKLNSAITWKEVAQRLMGLHYKLWHAPGHDMVIFLKAW